MRNSLVDIWLNVTILHQHFYSFMHIDTGFIGLHWLFVFYLLRCIDDTDVVPKLQRSQDGSED